MKRMLMFVIVVVLLLFFSGAAYPAGLSRACFQWDSFDDTDHLIFKSMGTVSTSAGKVKIYAVNGEHHAGSLYSFPVTGTAHVSGTVVHYTLSGAYNDAGTLWSFNAECFYDLANPSSSGNLGYFRFFYSGGDGGVGSFSLTAVDCTQSLIPYDVTDGLPPMNPKR
jgi:hypothetical protein